MKFLRTVLLPLLLCGIILTVGFCSPTLFSAVVSDHKGRTERVAIAGQENPLYLENAAEVSLPPWDAIGDDRGVPLSAYSASTAEDVPRISGRIASLAPCLTTRPSAITTISSAILRIRS